MYLALSALLTTSEAQKMNYDVKLGGDEDREAG